MSTLEVSMATVIFYSSSNDVLWWIRGHGHEFRAFIANRIGKIQMNTEQAQWQHVSRDQNPADLCTRGRTPEVLSDCALWWNGLEWLLNHWDRWPKMKLDNCPNDLPDKKTANTRNDSDKNVVEIPCHHQRPVFERKKIRSTETTD